MESSRDQGALVVGLRPLTLGDYARTAPNIRQAQARPTPSVGKTHFALEMEWPLLL
jgi:hypothetical protein